MVIADLNQEAGEKAVAELAAGYGTKPLFVSCNVTDKSAVDAAVAKIVETYGRLDVLINNAGINIPRFW